VIAVAGAKPRRSRKVRTPQGRTLAQARRRKPTESGTESPGAPEIPANGLDDDCAGGDRPGKILALVAVNWKLTQSHLRLVRLRVEDAPPSAQIAILCRGKCRFRTRHTQAGATGHTALLRLIPRRFRPRSTLEVRITAPNMIGKVVRYRILRHRIRRGQIPLGQRLCLPPGTTRPRRC